MPAATALAELATCLELDTGKEEIAGAMQLELADRLGGPQP